MAHNIRGPHDAVFYKLLDELKEARRPAAPLIVRQTVHLCSPRICTRRLPNLFKLIFC